MSLLAADQLTSDLRETNHRLSSLLDNLLPAAAPPGSEPRVATPQQMARLLSELLRAGQRLRTLPAHKDAALEQELTAYRKLVERLRAVMPAIHGALLRERARLERERHRVRAVSEWARVSRETL